jgi:hypothetical protein
MISEEIRTIKKKLSSLHQDNRKIAFKAFQELPKLCPWAD